MHVWTEGTKKRRYEEVRRIFLKHIRVQEMKDISVIYAHNNTGKNTNRRIMELRLIFKLIEHRFIVRGYMPLLSDRGFQRVKGYVNTTEISSMKTKIATVVSLLLILYML
jgi:hypothetical protein